MSTPPARRRRISSLVTVRRAQSERRYMSPWQSTHASYAGFWHPVLYPSQKVPSPPSGYVPFGPPKPSWGRMERGDHRVNLHHHAPRTALIPPAHPRSQQPKMIGRSQLVLNGDLWGSVKHRPRVPLMCPAQLPPLALGSPPPLMAVPPMILPQDSPQDKLAQDRLTAFLSGETASTYKPRSILSCPESPLYESLVSTFSTLEDDVNLPDTDIDHEYQQIPALVNNELRKPMVSQENDKNTTPAPSPVKTQNSDILEESSEYQTVADAKISTLDVRPEKNVSKENDQGVTAETQTCCCQSSKASGGLSPVSKKVDNFSQTVSPSVEFQNNTTDCNDDRGASTDTLSSLSDSDTYQDIDRPPTVIYLPSSSKETSGRTNSTVRNEENVRKGPEPRQSPSFKTQDKRVVSPRLKSNTPLASSTVTLKTSHSTRSNNYSSTTRVSKKSVSKTPETTYLPLTIELPETKDTPRKQDLNQKNIQNKPTGPHIITTLDPPIKSKNLSDWSSESMDNEIPPLVVNFDSESEDDLVFDTDVSSTTIENNSTSVGVTECDTTSLYSSIPELYSAVPGDTDSFVYVYKATPHVPSNQQEFIRHPESIGYRIPYHTNRSDDSISSCSSCASDPSWNDTISFVEPTYRPVNLLMGSEGHLKFDYSWSWNNLDNFIRTTSPRGGGSGSGVGGGGGSSDGRVGSPRRSVYSDPNSQRRPSGERKVSRGSSANFSGAKVASSIGVTPWEKYSDPVAG